MEKHILNRVNVSKFAFFVIKHSVNVDEIFYYAVVVFNRLLNYYHREFKENDIIIVNDEIFVFLKNRIIFI